MPPGSPWEIRPILALSSPYCHPAAATLYHEEVNTAGPSPGVGPPQAPLAPQPSTATLQPAAGPTFAPALPDDQPAGDVFAKFAPYLEIKVAPERATLLLKANHAMERLIPTFDVLKTALVRAGMAHGCDDDLLQRIVTEKLFDRTHIVAHPTLPQDGADARIETLVKVSGEAKPVVLEDGRADYRNIDNIQQVAEGMVLQVKHPAGAGIAGCDVLGQPMPATPGKDVELKPGFNTEVSPDGLQLVAKRGGYLFAKGDILGVGEDFQVQGDVGFKTGNIRYHGDVHIAGGVADGFSVEADGHIIIDGTVDGARIVSTGGSITLKGAVFGHGRAELHAAKDITLLAAQDCRIVAGGMLTVEKELRLCQVVCGGLKADADKCHIVGGTLVSYGETRIAQIGAEGVRTEIRVGDKAQEEARISLAENNHKTEQLSPLLPSLEQKLRQFKLTADRLHGHLPVRMAAELKGTVQRYAEVQKAVRNLKEEEARLRSILATPLERRHPVAITEKIIDSVHLKLYGLHADLTEADAPAQWLFTDEGLLKATLI